MGDFSPATNGNHEAVGVNVKEDGDDVSTDCIFFTVPFIQKIIVEMVGTYFLMFAGCAAIVVDANKGKVVTLPGIAIVWGLVVMVVVYSVGHISRAHINPTVTISNYVFALLLFL